MVILIDRKVYHLISTIFGHGPDWSYIKNHYYFENIEVNKRITVPNAENNYY